MERKIPGCVPRILPLVGHRNDVLIYHVEPFAVPYEASAGLHRILTMFREPFVHVEEEILLAPEHPGQCLPHDNRLIFVHTFWSYGLVELIGLALAGLHDLGEALEGIAYGSRPQIA